MGLMPIQILPPEISDQIAAGEVVERPSSVIKELVENAIDAGATNIEIYIERGGKKLIEVRDDGRGMSESDAEKCILRHATSKIQKIDDLFSIQSFGFRGEALAAISAVSNFELLTKVEDVDSGTKITVSAGKMEEKSAASANVGTQIKVQDLFFPTPARLQYLKTEETEYRAILREVVSFALSHPEVGFKLSRDEKLGLDLPPVFDQKVRIQKILKYGSEDLLSVKLEEQGMMITGYVCRPDKCAKTKNHQYLFVNGRRIEDFRLAYAIREAYQRSCGIEKHLHPVFVLFLTLDPILVDVNVHPRKLEVKFSEPGDVFSAVKKGVTISLEQGSEGVNKFSFDAGAKNPSPRQAGELPLTKGALGQKGGGAVNDFNQSMFGGRFSERNERREQLTENKEQNLKLQITNNEKRNPNNEERSQTEMKLIGQLANKYILAESGDGFFVFDQHALHERQRFERLCADAEQQRVEVQKLLLPESLAFSPTEYSALWENKAELEALGFVLNFSEPVVEIVAVPVLLVGENFRALFEDFVYYFENEKVGEHQMEKLLREVLERKSCRGSVMFGDPMTREAMQQLLDDFNSTKWKLLCPHGRPNHVFMGFEELDRMFHR